jgi:light-regulated signal transduction histidine kinase (bacteriophytochrome)
VFLALVVGVVDYMTGTELSISIFYLLPISLMAWFVDRRAGIFLSLISSVIQLVTDIVAGHTYSHPIIVYWNNAVQLGFFLIIVFISSALKVEYERTVRLNANLQDTLAKLTRAQDELERKAQDLARSNVELEQFAYVAAHDLKGPLVVAGGHIHRLRRLFQGKMHPDATRSIEYALDGINRMEALIHGLLAYAKVGTKAKKLNPSDCNDIVELATANLQVEIEKAGAIVTHNQLPTLFSDDIQILQLFQNLIGNSIKFHKEEPPRIHVCAEQNEKEWVFSVCDNGIGIEPKNLNCIFDIFQRLHSSPEFPGNGIGLAICKKIVENHGGRIWVESNPQKGSIFYFTIPIKDAATTQ